MQVKEMLQREVQRAEEDARRNQSIIADYKQICTKLGRRLEEHQLRASQTWEQLQATIADCPHCSGLLGDLSSLVVCEQSSPDPAGPGAITSVDSGKPRSPVSAESRFELKVRSLNRLNSATLSSVPESNHVLCPSAILFAVFTCHLLAIVIYERQHSKLS